MKGGDIKNMDIKGLNEVILLDKNQWRRIIHITNRRDFFLVQVIYPKYLGKKA